MTCWAPSPTSEVHHYFNGLDADMMEPINHYGFSLKRMLNRYCLPWAFEKNIGEEKKAGYIRAVSVRRHPMQALKSGAK